MRNIKILEQMLQEIKELKYKSYELHSEDYHVESKMSYVFNRIELLEEEIKESIELIKGVRNEK